MFEYNGQLLEARKFLLSKGMVTLEELSFMSDEQVSKAISKEYVVLKITDTYDLVLIPKAVFTGLTILHR